ncbi:MAG: twin-arginine translocation signal domain-containing protein, partial [Acidimicrobiales bacterium]
MDTTTETDTEEHSSRGLSRRDLMKAGAVVGGAVWVAP